MRYLLVSATMALIAHFSPVSAADCAKAVTTVAKAKLTVAAYDYPPFTIVSKDGQISGVDADIVKRAAADNCLEVVPLVMDPAATIQAVVSGRADVAIGAWNRTEKRSQVLGLSAPTYLDPMGIFSKSGADTVGSLVGKNVGTITGYQWVAELQALLGNKLKLYPNEVAMAQDLEAGRIEIGIGGYNAALYAQNTAGAYKGLILKVAQPDQRVQASVEPAQSGVLYTKGNASLGEALDASVKKQHAGGQIQKDVVALGFDKKLADVGEPRLVK